MTLTRYTELCHAWSTNKEKDWQWSTEMKETINGLVEIFSTLVVKSYNVLMHNNKLLMSIGITPSCRTRIHCFCNGQNSKRK